MFPHLEFVVLIVQSADPALAVPSQFLYFPAMPFPRRMYPPSFAAYRHVRSFFPLIGLYILRNFSIFLSSVLKNLYSAPPHVTLSDNLLLTMQLSSDTMSRAISLLLHTAADFHTMLYHRCIFPVSKERQLFSL